LIDRLIDRCNSQSINQSIYLLATVGNQLKQHSKHKINVEQDSKAQKKQNKKLNCFENSIPLNGFGYV